jgi:hypothetical protein
MLDQRIHKARLKIPARTELALLVGMLALVAIYTMLRYGGLWGETDTYTRTGDILTVLHAGHLVPADGESVYPNGYGFQAIAVFLANIAGVSVAQLQIYGSALLAIWIVVPAWLAYRELTGSARGGTLATIFLFIQPEFLFVVMRGTHEKFTRGLMLLCLYLLARSLRGHVRPVPAGGVVVSFYLAAFAIASLNNLLANSFILALGLGLLLCWLALLRLPSDITIVRPTVRRLGLATVVALIFVFLITFYIYPPAQHDLTVLQTIGQRAQALALDVEQESTNPYEMINTGWISLPVYLAVSLANWLLLGFSALVWAIQSISWLRGRWRPQHPRELLLWALYGAFGIQGALSIVSDLSGAIDGTLQHRLFPSIVMLAAPVAAGWLADWRPRSARRGSLVYGGLAAGLGLLAMLSIFKATNEPLVSNKWLFYLPAERRAIDWADAPLADRYLWTEFDERLATGVGTVSEGAPRQAVLDQFEPTEGTRDYMISDVTRVRSVRLGVPLPLESDSLLTYDNGQAQIYHLRPRTPYQR